MFNRYPSFADAGSTGHAIQQERMTTRCRIGLALGGGFARGIAHAGVLRVLAERRIPIHCVAGVSAGSVAAAAFSSGASAEEIVEIGSSMRFSDVGKLTIGRMGFAGSDRMEPFLKKLLKSFRFEDMRIPLGIVATDLESGEPVIFRDRGDVTIPLRASCSYPGLFQPVKDGARLLVDGAMSMAVPSRVCRALGATHVISVNLPSPGWKSAGANVFNVVNRCFQIVQSRSVQEWRDASDIIITPQVGSVGWSGFNKAAELILAGEQAAREAITTIESWLPPRRRSNPLTWGGLLPVNSPAGQATLILQAR
jgi:NTE family protein